MAATVNDRELVVGGQAVAPGSRAAIRVPVTVGLNGAELALWVHVVRGRQPGPTLVLLSGLHGGEWFSIDVVRRLVLDTDPENLRGAIVAAPTVNGPALALNTRNIPDESDSPDLNRIFPGPLTWTSDQIIATVAREMLPLADCVLDYHMGPYGSAFQDILIGQDLPDPAVSAESERLALAFGSPIVRRANVMTGFPGPKSSIGYCAGILGVPALGIEVGGLGFGPRLEDHWQRASLDGTNAVMGALGMLPTAPERRPARQLIYTTSMRVNPTSGGLLRSRFGGDKLGTAVAKGDLLGEVISPYTFDVLEELRAPAAGLLFYVARDYPVHPGDWAFGIANTEQGARWIDNTGRGGAA